MVGTHECRPCTRTILDKGRTAMRAHVAEHSDGIAVADSEQRSAQQCRGDSVAGSNQLIRPAQRQPPRREHEIDLSCVVLARCVVGWCYVGQQVAHISTIILSSPPKSPSGAIPEVAVLTPRPTRLCGHDSGTRGAHIAPDNAGWAPISNSQDAQLVAAMLPAATAVSASAISRRTIWPTGCSGVPSRAWSIR